MNELENKSIEHLQKMIIGLDFYKQGAMDMFLSLAERIEIDAEEINKMCSDKIALCEAQIAKLKESK